MDFSLSDEEKGLQERIAAFGREELNAGLAERDRDETFLPELWEKCAGAGLFSQTVPEEFGGSGRDVFKAVLMLEALGRGCRDNGLTLAINSQVWTVQEPLLEFGTEEQKRRFLPGLCAGKIICSDAITEKGAGSDALAMETTARREGDVYILDGRKDYIGMAPIADMALVYAKTNPEAGTWGLSAFLVKKGTTGFTATEGWSKMGLRTLPSGGFELKDCAVPVANRLGEEGAGMSLFNHAAEWERCFILCSHVGAMERQLDECVEYARSREQFGKAIGSFQSVSNRIAEMRVRLETSKLMLHKLAWMKGRGESAMLEAAIANLVHSEAFVASSLDAIRTHGARGYSSDHGVERDLRDAVGGVIYAGTSDVQRNLIARMLGL